MVPSNFLLHFLYALGPVLVTLFGAWNYYSDYVKTTYFGSEENLVYDFIVVGGGAAGSAVVRRLSATGNFKILLLEAGGNPTPFNSIPGLAIDLLGYQETDWMHKTVPQKHACWALKNNQSLWSAGKVLGGSTTLNFMFYLRGHPSDYDNWAKLTGDPEWSYKSVLPFFKKSIKSYNGGYKDNEEHYEESEYGFLNIDGRNWLPLFDELLEAGKLRGYPYIDPNGGSQRSGIAMIENTQKDGMRFGTYAAIIQDLEKKAKNVVVQKYSEVIKIHFDKNMRADGVWYLHHGVKKFARASKEVILSAGSVNSPKILMLSGIGPKSHLNSVGIKTRLDLRGVGKNLHDHVMTSLFFTIKKPLSFLAERDFSIETLNSFANGTGMLTVPNGLHSQLFYSSKKVRNNSADWPDIQGFFAPLGISPFVAKAVSRGTNIREEMLMEFLEPYFGTDAFAVLLGLVRPKSRGNIKLRDSNPLSTPLIDPHYFEHPDDLEAFVDGVMEMVNFFEESAPFKALESQFPNNPIPGCEEFPLRSPEYYKCYIQHYSLTIWHPVGTCRMGQGQDNFAVVDTKLRLHGAKGLRVIDASIMPEIVNVNTMAASIMIGEKGGHFIRDYWASQFLVCDKMLYLLFREASVCSYSVLI